MSDPPPTSGHRIGDIVNGHVLAGDGTWYQIQPPPDQPAQSVGPPTYDHAADVFRGQLPAVVRLAMRAVQDLGWTLVEANDTLGLVVFETGVTWGSWSGVTGSISFEETEPLAWRATGSGKQNVRGGQTIAIDFGEAKGKPRAVVERMVQLAEGR